MKKFILFALLVFTIGNAQEQKERIFNFGPMVRVNGILPMHFGENYLNDSDSKISVGISLSPFEVYRFRCYIGVDHLYYKTHNMEMAADVTSSKTTSIYGLLSYRAPITENLSFEPYFGGGWTGLMFNRPENDFFDQHDLNEQDAAQFRLGFFTDYKIAPFASVFLGAAYVLDSYEVNTVPEYKEYFGEAQSFQISFGMKLGFTMNDKRKARAAAQQQ